MMYKNVWHIMCGKAALDFEKYSLHHFESHNFGALKHSLWIFISLSSALYILIIHEIIPCKILSYIFCTVFFVCLLCFRYSNCLYQPPHFPYIILVFCCSLFRVCVPLVLVCTPWLGRIGSSCCLAGFCVSLLCGSVLLWCQSFPSR